MWEYYKYRSSTYSPQSLKPMKRKQEKPTYGNSQGSKSSEVSSELGRKKSSASSAPQYAQSGEFTDRKNHNHRSLRSNSATLTSLPRTIFKVGIIILILYPVLVYTPIGKSITTRVSKGIAGIKQKIGGIQPEKNLKTMGENRQRAADERFDDALKKSGIEPDKK
jgi:hypothetical protein